MTIACVAAKPGIIAPLAYSAPLVAAPIVTATSSQVFARNYNGFAAPLIAAPAPLAYSSPLGYASPYLASPYVASPYAAAAYSAYSPYLAGASPLRYTAAGPVLL